MMLNKFKYKFKTIKLLHLIKDYNKNKIKILICKKELINFKTLTIN